MTLPKWNSEWEKPDPLRTRRGWMLHHYASFAVAAILLVTALGVLLPTVPKARQKADEQNKIWEQLRNAMSARYSTP